jgi:glycosyltransferase involved in cell wall biosynthesis
VTYPTILRVYDSVRTAHLERLRNEPEVHLVYRHSSYDFDKAMADEVSIAQSTRLGIARRIISGEYRIVELNEPLMLAAWPSSLLYSAAARFSRMRGHDTRFVSYAIENGDVVEWTSSRLRLPPRVAAWLVRTIGGILLGSLDRLAFGTAGAEASYHSYLPDGASWPATRLFEPLEPACDCEATSKLADSVAFVGSLEARKGVPQLMDSWPLVLESEPEATLTIVGSGELLESVTRWAAQFPSVVLIVDPPRGEIHRVLARASVAVLISQRELRWREQVGLPIIEALSHGCRIVASRETGLADWLTGHRHSVVEAGSSGPEYAEALLSALSSDRTARDVRDDLPTTSGRQTASAWMVEGDHK